MKTSLPLLVLIVFLVTLAGCAKDKAVTSKQEPDQQVKQILVEPESKDLSATAEKVVSLTEQKKWDSLYDYLSKDIKESVSKDQFVDLKNQESRKSKIEYKNYKLGEARKVSQWVNKINGKTYTEVSEIPYTVDVVTPKGEFSVENSMYFIQNSEQNWRYIWIRK